LWGASSSPRTLPKSICVSGGGFSYSHRAAESPSKRRGAGPERYPTPPMTEGDYYSVSQAAKILKVTHGRIRQMLGSGELEGEKDEAGHWIIPAHVVHDRPRPPRVERVPAAPTGPPESTGASENLSDLLDRGPP
jgi:hypothetical protein